jgi:mono/diheme cytochrome c family protein
MSPAARGLGLGLMFAGIVAATAVAGSRDVPEPTGSAVHFADADDQAQVTLGNKIYLGRCASCHGRELQGQPLWQIVDQFADRRAPAHDATGHTWLHADEEIFHMTKYGRFASRAPNAVSHMPAFKGVLDDRQILAVVAFIKARWPIGLRIAQAMLNPGQAGMPRHSDDVDWRLPPSCNAILRLDALATSPR